MGEWIDKRTAGKGNQVFSVVLLEALEVGRVVPACIVR